MTADTAATAAPEARCAGLPQLPVLSPEYQADPHRCHRQAREHGPVAASPLGLVALSYDTVRTVLRDRRFGQQEAMGWQPKASPLVRCGIGLRQTF